MTPENTNKLQNMFLALVIGLIVPPAIGFGTGLWVTKDSAERKASEDRVAAYSAMCVVQFNSAPNAAARLKEYKALEYSAQSTFLEKGGWAKVPGEEKASDEILRACSERLGKL